MFSDANKNAVKSNIEYYLKVWLLLWGKISEDNFY